MSGQFLIRGRVGVQKTQEKLQDLLVQVRPLSFEADGSRIVEFSLFSVNEFLTSSSLAMGRHSISRYHVLMAPAQTIVAQAWVGALVHLDGNISIASRTFLLPSTSQSTGWSMRGSRVCR